MAKFDLSTEGAHEKVTRLVRPFNSIGPASGGDEVTLDASELLHPAVNDALWSEDEMRKVERELDAQRRAAMRTEDPVAQQVDAQLKKAGKDRERRKAEKAAEDLAKLKDAAIAMKAIMG